MLKIYQMLIFSWYLKFMYIFFKQVRVNCNLNIFQEFCSFQRRGKLNFILNCDLSLSSFRVKVSFLLDLVYQWLHTEFPIIQSISLLSDEIPPEYLKHSHAYTVRARKLKICKLVKLNLKTLLKLHNFYV